MAKQGKNKSPKAPTKDTAPNGNNPPAERKQTKKSQLIQLLSAGKPACLDELSGALGWQRHTTSAAMTRLKQEGYQLVSEKPDGKRRVYHLGSTPTDGDESAAKASSRTGGCDADTARAAA